MRSAPLPENIMPCGAGTVKKKYGFFRIHASLKVMSWLKRPQGQDPSPCLKLAGAASSKARQLRKQGQHHDTPRNPDDYAPSHGAAVRL